MKIKIFSTGGTIDKVYNEITGELTFSSTHVGEMLKRARCRIDVNIESIFMKDSLDMHEEDRQLILDRCRKCEESHIVITHGTDTMVETSCVLGKNIKDKTIVLLGAMVPYAMKDSDALFNLGCAITGVQLLSSGIYITMNGNVFSWDNVAKNRELAIFERAN